MKTPLAGKLSVMLADDQSDVEKHRLGRLSQEDWLIATGARTAYLKELIDAHGLATIGRDGIYAYKAMLTLVLHSGEPSLLERYLALFEAAMPHDRTVGDKAFIMDKLAVLKGERQIYGTQVSKVGEIFVPYPIQDEENIDAMRQELDLTSLAEYLDRFNGNS